MFVLLAWSWRSIINLQLINVGCFMNLRVISSEKSKFKTYFLLLYVLIAYLCVIVPFSDAAAMDPNGGEEAMLKPFCAILTLMTGRIFKVISMFAIIVMILGFMFGRMETKVVVTLMICIVAINSAPWIVKTIFNDPTEACGGIQGGNVGKEKKPGDK